MTQFTSTFVHESEFDGDHVLAEFKRLKRKHVAKLSPFFVAAEGGEVKFRLSMTQQIEILAVLEDILPDVVVRLEGLKDKGGNALKIADIVDSIYFMPLLQSWMGALLQNSFLGATDEKKSAAPLPDAT